MLRIFPLTAHWFPLLKELFLVQICVWVENVQRNLASNVNVGKTISRELETNLGLFEKIFFKPWFSLFLSPFGLGSVVNDLKCFCWRPFLEMSLQTPSCESEKKIQVSVKNFSHFLLKFQKHIKFAMFPSFLFASFAPKKKNRGWDLWNDERLSLCFHFSGMWWDSKQPLNYTGRHAGMHNMHFEENTSLTLYRLFWDRQFDRTQILRPKWQAFWHLQKTSIHF